jgi:hypothetical protein
MKKCSVDEIPRPEDRFEEITRRLQDLRADARVVVEAELARRLPARPAPEEKETDDPYVAPDSRPHLSRMAMKIIEGRDPEEPFGPLWLTREVNRRFADKLSRRISHRQMADALRRLAQKGVIRQVREGKVRHEPWFVRVESPGLPESSDAHHTG